MLYRYRYLVQPFVRFAEAWIQGEWFNSRIRVEVAGDKKILIQEKCFTKSFVWTWEVALSEGLSTDSDPFLRCWELRWPSRSGFSCCWKTSFCLLHPLRHWGLRLQYGKPCIIRLKHFQLTKIISSPIRVMAELIKFLKAVLNVCSTWGVTHFLCNPLGHQS